MAKVVRLRTPPKEKKNAIVAACGNHHMSAKVSNSPGRRQGNMMTALHPPVCSRMRQSAENLLVDHNCTANRANGHATETTIGSVSEASLRAT